MEFKIVCLYGIMFVIISLFIRHERGTYICFNLQMTA